MKIKINDNWGITSDKYGYQLCKIKKVKDTETGVKKEVFRAQEYYRKLEDTFEAYVRYCIRTEKNITGFKQVVDLQKELLEEIEEIKDKLEV